MTQCSTRRAGKSSVAGDFKAAGCPLHRAGKMHLREANRLAMVRTMLQAAGRDAETHVLWSKSCVGLMNTWPTIPRHPRDVERAADGCAITAWMQRATGSPGGTVSGRPATAVLLFRDARGGLMSVYHHRPATPERLASNEPIWLDRSPSATSPSRASQA